MWTGLNDLVVPGMFTWADEHMVTFTYWAPGQPNNHVEFNEDCVEMSYQVRGMGKTALHTSEMHFMLQIQRQNLTNVQPAWKNPSCAYYRFFAVKCGHFDVNFISAPDWPMERRVLCRTQYLHMQNAQSTLPSALCKTHCVRMPSGRKKKHSSNINFSVFLSTLAPSYDAS